MIYKVISEAGTNYLSTLKSKLSAQTSDVVSHVHKRGKTQKIHILFRDLPTKHSESTASLSTEVACWQRLEEQNLVIWWICC